MSYQGPVGGVPEKGVDPYDRYRVEQPGGGRSGGEPPDEEPPDGKGFIAYLIQAMQKALNRFFERAGGPRPRALEDKTLNALKTSFEILKIEDRSQDVDFLNELAENWSKAIEESLDYDEEAKQTFQIFVKKILHYPENQLHTFGYYLTEHAGQKWVPFPYMELVQKIHREHEESPSTSALTEWTRLLDDTIRLVP